MTDKISKALGTEYEEHGSDDMETIDEEINNLPDVVDEDSRSMVVAGLKDDELEDYNLARETIHRVIQSGKTALDFADALVDGSDTEKSFDALAKIMKETKEAAKDLLELQNKKQALLHFEDSIDPKGTKEVNNTIENMNVFTGSSADLLKQLESMNKDKVIDVTDDS